MPKRLVKLGPFLSIYTYTRPCQGHIKHIKEQLKHATKGSQTVTEYMQFIKMTKTLLKRFSLDLTMNTNLLLMLLKDMKL